MSRPFARGKSAFVACLLSVLALPFSARAQTPTPQLPIPPFTFDFYARGPFKPDLPRPATLLGYEPGTFQTPYANYERFLRELATKSDRLKVMTLGETPEHRPLYLLAVSTPENLSRLDAIKADMAKLADPRVCSDAEAAAIAARSPMVVWLSYSIHGDESAAFEAGIQVLYQLTASDDPKLVDALGKCVVLINPCQNPDGHERFTAWYNAVGIGRPEPFAYEHTQPWGIRGRLNHYYFDMNRDLVAGSQIESRTAMKAFLEWHPQVNADHHGQVTNYFFAPASLPINPSLDRAQVDKWQTVIGQGNAAAFDRFHWLYYVRDVYDLFYPGYWDSWPSLHGSTGMTYETGGGGTRGFNWWRDDHTIETETESIAKHFVASLATVETSAVHREERLHDYYKFFVSAIEEGKAAKDGLRMVAIPWGEDHGRAAALVMNLARHGVEVRRVRNFTLPNAHDYLTGKIGPREFKLWSYVIDLAQPQERIARTLLTPDSPLGQEFYQRQLDRQSRNLKRGRHEPDEAPEFYDMTAWCLPLTFGVDAVYSADAPPAPEPDFTEPVGTDFQIRADYGPKPGEATTAYLWSPESESSYRLAFRLLQDGYHVAAATYPLNAVGNDYPRGTLLARVERNPASLRARIKQLSDEYGVGVTAVNTAFPDKGPVGVGSETVVSLKVPKVAVIAGDETSQTSYAEITYLLGHEYGVEFVPLTVEAFKDTPFGGFNVLILPDGRSKQYRDAFDKEGVEKLKDWCKDGGTLICVGGAAGFAADKKVNLTGSRVVAADLMAKADEADEKGGDDDSDDTGKPPTDKEGQVEGKKPAPPESAAPEPSASPSPKDGPDTAKPTGKEKSGDTGATGEGSDKTDPKGFDRRKIPLPVPGAILRAHLNLDHFLTFGYEQDTLPVLVDTDQFLTPTKRGANVVTFSAAPPEGKDAPPLRLAGFVWPDNTERLIRGTSAVVEEPLGAGHVILTANGPSSRLFWHASTRLWLNGLLYAPAIHGDDNN